MLNPAWFRAPATGARRPPLPKKPGIAASFFELALPTNMRWRRELYSKWKILIVTVAAIQ
jgi:hypothetical protein